MSICIHTLGKRTCTEHVEKYFSGLPRRPYTETHASHKQVQTTYGTLLEQADMAHWILPIIDIDKEQLNCYAMLGLYVE